MAKIGFSASRAEEKREEETLEALERTLHDFESTSADLIRDLKSEIKNLDHLKSNIKILEGQIKEAEELHRKSKNWIRGLVAMEENPSFDIEKSEEMLKRVGYYQEIITRKLELVKREIKKYILNEAHEILSANVNNYGQIQKIDGTARELIAVISEMESEMQASIQNLGRINQTIQIRKNQPNRME